MWCPGCFVDKGEVRTCPHCGYDEAKRSPIVLPPRTLLADQYLIGRVLGEPGGFGITYLAWDTRLEMRVAIKEFMPRDLATRITERMTVVPGLPEYADFFYLGLEKFLQEARTLAKFDHPNIVRVRHYFETNGTGYIVMNYYEGASLQDLMDTQGGRLTEEQVTTVMMPVLDGLQAVHDQGFLHRDIKPANVYLAGGTKPILLDFGAARMAVGEKSRNLSVILTPGFAPYEQYYSQGKQGPWTDIYACGAMLYYLVSGEVPPFAIERVDRDRLVPLKKRNRHLSDAFCAAVEHALAVRPEERPQQVRELQRLMRGSAAPAPLPSPSPEETHPGQVMVCPHCQARNRVPPGPEASRARCGRCTKPLFGNGEEAQSRLVACKHCGAKNRLHAEALAGVSPSAYARCGKCGQVLPA